MTERYRFLYRIHSRRVHANKAFVCLVKQTYGHSYSTTGLVQEKCFSNILSDTAVQALSALSLFLAS